MKKVLTLAMAALFLASCSSDDNDEPTINVDHLQKRWYPESTRLNDGDPQPYDGHESCGKDYTEFQANNAMREVDVVDCQTDPVVTTGTYNLQDETLTTSVGGTTVVYTIKKLNANTLELETTFNGNTITDIFTSNPSD